MQIHANHLGIHSNFRRTRGGFTLIELLAVLGVIAILQTVLVPVFDQARDKARNAARVVSSLNVGPSRRMDDHISRVQVEAEELRDSLTLATEGKDLRLADTRRHQQRVEALLEDNLAIREQIENAIIREKTAVSRKALAEALDALAEMDSGLQSLADYLAGLEKLERSTSE